MKQQSITNGFVSFAATFVTTLLFAQEPNLTAVNHFKEKRINAITNSIEKASASPATETVYIKAKVMRSFLQSFTDASDVKWSESNDRYLASFKQAGKICKAHFHRSGGLIFSLRYHTEKDLPPEVRRLLKSTYIDYTIGAVTEVSTNNLKAWIVNLTDNDNLIVTSICDGSLYELEHYKTHF